MTCESRSGLCGRVLLRWASVLLGAAIPALAAPPPGGLDLRQAGAELAWSLSMSLQTTTSIRSYTLINEYLFAIGTDGFAHCIRADTGEFKWSLQVAPGGETLWSPELYHDPKAGERVAFVRLNEAIFVDPANGLPVKQVRLRSPSSAPPAFGPARIYIPSVDNQLISYDIAKDEIRWGIGTSKPLLIEPLYNADDDQLVVADFSGRIASVNAQNKVKRFAKQLDGEPKGWLVADAAAIYVATAGDAPMLHALDRKTGDTLWEYRLAGWPDGGPVVTRSAVYQSIADGGVHRVGLDRTSPNWYAKDARRFLAEWPRRVALLQRDGSIGFVEIATGRPTDTPPIAGLRFTAGISNVFNDAAIAATSRGEIRCIRPAGAKPLTPALFGRPTTRPAGGPATRPAASEPAAPGAPPADSTTPPAETPAPAESAPAQ